MVQISERTVSEMWGLHAVYMAEAFGGGVVFLEDKDFMPTMTALSDLLPCSKDICVEEVVSDIVFCDNNPIESLMAGFLFNVVWCFLDGKIPVFYETKYSRLEFRHQENTGKDETIIKISQQVKEDKYRIDFVINVINKTKGIDKKIGIECDGYAYHEKTQDRMIYEKKRQRYLIEKGYVMMHFMGKEIKDAAKNRNYGLFGGDIYIEIAKQVKKILDECKTKKKENDI